MTISNKKRNTIIIATGIVIKISYDKKVEQERVIAVQAQVEADKLAEEKKAAEKAEADRLAAEKAEADRIAEEEKLAKEAEEKAAQLLEEASKKETEVSPNPPTSSTPDKPASSKPESKPSGGGGTVISPGEKPSSKPSGGAWDNFPGNLPEDLKKDWYEYYKEYIGKPEPGPGHENRDFIYDLMEEGWYQRIE